MKAQIDNEILTDPRHIKIEDFDFNLPDDRIAKYPVVERDKSKLLLYQKGHISEKKFYELPTLLDKNDLLVFNNTKVIQARLLFRKPSGASIEIFCLEPVDPEEYVMAFESKGSCTWKCLIGNVKKWKTGLLKQTISNGSEPITFSAQKKQKLPDAFEVKFSWDQVDLSFGEILEISGVLPIPPYLNRETETNDYKTYQTVYSRIKGSVAAPTAGLHFSKKVIAGVKAKGIKIEEITLHVGAGTFKPVSTEKIGDHAMHSEQFIISKKILENLLNHKGRIIAVGTTSVRTLESLYWLGLRIFRTNSPGNRIISQWEAYDQQPEISTETAFLALLDYMTSNKIEQFAATTGIMITPAYSFQVVDGLITNYHLPKSTLLLLIASLIGPDWKRVYDFALNNDFRFLSYGDSSLLLP